MPAYADWYNEHRPPNVATSANPVRMTISGQYTLGPDGQTMVYTESWDQEDLMDQSYSGEESDGGSDGEGLGSMRPGWSIGTRLAEYRARSHVSARRIDDEASHDMIFAHDDAGAPQGDGRGGGGASLLVLDTNTLIDSLQFFETLFSHLLYLNLSYLTNSLSPGYTSSGSSTPYPAPFSIVIPHMVMRELDGLKSSSKSAGVGSGVRKISEIVREANRWILAALQAQKRATIPVYINGEEARVPLPESAWALHCQTRAHADKTGSLSNESPDSRILSCCTSLSSPSVEVFLLSSDVNICSLAEVEGIRSLSLLSLLEGTPQAREMRRRRGEDLPQLSATEAAAEGTSLQKAVREMVEQWGVQICGWDPSTLEVEAAHVQQAEKDVAMDAEDEPTKAPASGINASVHATTGTNGKSTQQSPTTDWRVALLESGEVVAPTAAMSSVRSRPSGAGERILTSTHTATLASKARSGDRSSAASIWAT